MDMSLTSNSAADVTASLLTIVQQLTESPSLRPGPAVNALFSQLVHTALDTPDETASAVLDHPALRSLSPRLHDLCARGESELEYEWAARICTSPDPHLELSRFPYLDNYRQLGRMELGALAATVSRPIRSVALIGCGPLPLSMLTLATELSVTVDGFDRDPDAIARARQVVDRLGATGLRFHRADASEADLAGYDLVVLAALVGSTPAAKREILALMRPSMKPGSILLARSARGLRTLLYPPVDLDNLPGFELITVVHPVDDVINSAVLARTRGGA